MKKLFSLVFALTAMICTPQLSQAAFFDNSDIFHDPTMWQEYSAADSSNEITITDNATLDRLEFASSRTTTEDGNAFRAVVFNDAFDLNFDFDITVGYYQAAINPVNVQGFSDLGIHFINGDADLFQDQKPQYVFNMTPRSSLIGDQGMAVRGTIGTPSEQLQFDWERTTAEGVLHAQYDASLDSLVLTDLYTGAGITVANLKTDYNLTSLKLALGASSDGYPYDGELAYFKNLSVAVVTPEPVSSVLFLVGGGAMAFARRRMLAKV